MSRTYFFNIPKKEENKNIILKENRIFAFQVFIAYFFTTVFFKFSFWFLVGTLKYTVQTLVIINNKILGQSERFQKCCQRGQWSKKCCSKFTANHIENLQQQQWKKEKKPPNKDKLYVCAAVWLDVDKGRAISYIFVQLNTFIRSCSPLLSQVQDRMSHVFNFLLNFYILFNPSGRHVCLWTKLLPFIIFLGYFFFLLTFFSAKQKFQWLKIHGC